MQTWQGLSLSCVHHVIASTGSISARDSVLSIMHWISGGNAVWHAVLQRTNGAALWIRSQRLFMVFARVCAQLRDSEVQHWVQTGFSGRYFELKRISIQVIVHRGSYWAHIDTRRDASIPPRSEAPASLSILRGDVVRPIYSRSQQWGRAANIRSAPMCTPSCYSSSNN